MTSTHSLPLVTDQKLYHNDDAAMRKVCMFLIIIEACHYSIQLGQVQNYFICFFAYKKVDKEWHGGLISHLSFRLSCLLCKRVYANVDVMME